MDILPIQEALHNQQFDGWRWQPQQQPPKTQSTPDQIHQPITKGREQSRPSILTFIPLVPPFDSKVLASLSVEPFGPIFRSAAIVDTSFVWMKLALL
jgi:hypothetical protein